MDGLLTNLLLKHNCVIIPELGGFVANRVPAYLDESKRKLYPPSKQLTFNSRLIKNDGLLVAAWAEKDNVSFDEALDNVKKETNLIQQKLRRGQSHHIDNIGTLYANEEGRINFRQDRFFNLLIESYGFGAVEFIPASNEIETATINQPKLIAEKQENTESKISQPKNDLFVIPKEKTTQLSNTTSRSLLDKEENDEVSATLKESNQDKTNQSSAETKKKRKLPILKYAAAAAILPLAFYSFWIPMTSDFLQSRILFKQDFNPFKEKVISVYNSQNFENIKKEEFQRNVDLENLEKNLPSHVDVFHYDLADGVYVPVWRKDFVASKNVNEVEINSSTIEKENFVSAKYHLIAGCFREIDNANGLVEDLNNKGFNAFILDKKDGLHRVTASQIDYKTEIENKRGLLNQVGFKTWVLKK